MSTQPGETTVVLEPVLPDVTVVLEPALPEVRVTLEPALPEVRVTLEPALPDVQVVLEPALPEVRVELAEVGLVGPRGPKGDPGLSGDDEGAASLEAHRVSATPHPAYDDMMDLTLIFENGLI